MVARWLVLKDLLGQHLGLDGWGVVVKVAHSDGHVGGGCVQWVRVLGNHCQVEELLIGLLIVHLLCNNRESTSCQIRIVNKCMVPVNIRNKTWFY